MITNIQTVFFLLLTCARVGKFQDGNLTITTKFINGDVIFTWTGASSEYYYVYVKKDGIREPADGSWSKNEKTNYTVKNALLYHSIEIGAAAPGNRHSEETYRVSKINKTVGDSVEISWTAPYFPRAGLYYIYHTNDENKSIPIISVTSNKVTTQNKKYEYLSQPLFSTNITFMIRDITLDDAGYYAGGYKAEDAWSGGGVVLIVLGKPSTPKITGILNIPVGDNCKLTCSSTSTSAPDYYAKWVKLSYRWFVNGSDVGDRSENMSFTVIKNHRHNQYSCEAVEKNLMSERSDPIQINPLFSKILKIVGESVEISWTTPFFPRAGAYNIYHTNDENKSIHIVRVTSNKVTTQNRKYKYLSQPLTSTNITFMIRDITLDDAGYYAGGTKAEDAWSGDGMVLIVLGKPSTPKITGILNIPVRDTCKLTCLSTSTSAPDYYAKWVKLSYRWFVNGTDVGERSKDLSFTVTKNHQYNQYSCEAMEKNLVSERSDPKQINPLYKPDMLSIKPEPQLLNGKLTVTEGETIGPYHCSADCNPPCSIAWKYKDTDGTIHDASSSGHELSMQRVNRNISLLRCVAIYKPPYKESQSLELDIQCKYFSITILSLFYILTEM
uniref:Uncharacterized protein LOC111112450 n=1 Tax=Crassostrea virginica TaxID=6565 RepID=A0A8B8BRS0_CRAVI|nr:uncharacterized protein LOC111112450 [Crassostrea virginica]XP_022305657.1 uncharacterized protein LOC111112450 [Crassostrea virginica]XP_022305658.1 uncharacterized protein LOC111112450 [Crassostrea virginica]XP_022305660.1 uncharacterized protein LOC111112450 [Crassostrea virginica]